MANRDYRLHSRQHGSIDPTAGKYPCKLQGIEFGVGCWEVLADTIISLTMETIDGVDTYYEEAFTVKDTSKQATSLTDDYKSCGIKILQNGEGWTKELKWGNNGLLYPTQIGGSSSTYCRDYHYHNNQARNKQEPVNGSRLAASTSMGGLVCSL